MNDLLHKWAAPAGLVLCMVVVLQPAKALRAQEKDPSSFPKGVVIPSVPCAASPGQSYALFLPSAYTPERAWPILYAFDPGAQGRVPVALVKEVAVKYGYIVAGSNNSRNGPIDAELEAAKAMWRDTHERFSLDPKRVYLTGFSGGARLATLVASLCGDCTAGVIGHGAGFSPDMPASRSVRFAYFAAIGNLDFNYPELVELAAQLDQLGIPNRLRRYDGRHQWAPVEVWGEAIEWMELVAMKQGRRPRDEQFIGEQFARASARARALEQAGALYAAYEEYRKLAQDFDGLGDGSSFVKKVAELKESPEVRKGRKREEEQIRTQKRLAESLLADLNVLDANPTRWRKQFMQLRAKFADLKEKIDRAKSPDEAAPARRAQTQVFAFAYESGQEFLRRKDFSLATAYFEVASEVLPQSPAPWFQLARAYAQSGRKAQALEALKRAVEKGLRDTALLERTAEFDSIRQDEEFRKIVAGLASSPK